MSASRNRKQQVDTIRQHAIVSNDYDQLNQKIIDGIPGSARIVLIGEASHGTREFYEQRAALTRLLIQQRGFLAVVAEADFPDAFRVNMFVRGAAEVDSVEEALAGFEVGQLAAGRGCWGRRCCPGLAAGCTWCASTGIRY